MSLIIVNSFKEDLKVAFFLRDNKIKAIIYQEFLYKIITVSRHYKILFLLKTTIENINTFLKTICIKHYIINYYKDFNKLVLLNKT